MRLIWVTNSFRTDWNVSGTDCIWLDLNVNVEFVNFIMFLTIGMFSLKYMCLLFWGIYVLKIDINYNTVCSFHVESHFGGLKSNLPDRYLGFKECQDEVMRCLVEVEGWDAADRLCMMLMSHLEQAGEKFRIMNGTYACMLGLSKNSVVQFATWWC